MPAVPLFNLATHKACDTVAVLLTRPTINHREPEGSKEHPAVSSLSSKLFIGGKKHCRTNTCEQAGNHVQLKIKILKENLLYMNMAWLTF